MKRILIAAFLFLDHTTFGQYVLTQDTTVDGTWSLGTKILKVNPGVKIYGTGTINGGYIDASYYQDIFDTSLTINIKGGAYNVVSTSWFGASPSKKDNTPYFQKAINAAIPNPSILYTPAGVYNDSTSLRIQGIYLGNYSGVSLHWKGDYRFNGAFSGTVINYLNTGNFAIGIQMGKGVILEGLSIQGKFKPPTTTGETYYNTSYGDYMDTSCTEYMSGIIVDPYANQNGSTSGSTGILFKDMSVSGFTTLFKISPAGTANAEEIIADRVNFGDGRVGWLSGQPQEKQNVIRNSMVWGRLFVFFKNYYQSGNYHIHDINIAGGVVQIFDINQSGWFPTKIDNIYAESIGRVGRLYTGAMNLAVENSVFQFAYKADAGNQYLVTSNSLNVTFRNCDFRYFGQTYSMAFSGVAAYDRCTFSGEFTNQSTGSVFTSNCQFLN